MQVGGLGFVRLKQERFADAVEYLERSVATNVTATGILIPYVAPLLGRDGQAVFLDDPRAGEKFFGAYGATKAAQIALAVVLFSSPRSAFTSAALALISPSALIKARGMGRPLTGKFSIARCVWAPHNAWRGTRSSPMLSRSIRKDLLAAKGFLLD